MITSCQFTKGYPLELPCLGKKAFSLQKGITLLFGPNGCGKSTLLQALATYSAIKGGGWTRFHQPVDISGISTTGTREYKFPKNFSKLARDVFEAKVAWDGTPTLYHHSGISDNTNFNCIFDSTGDSHDGITDPMEQVAAIAIKCSQGEMRIRKLLKVFGLLRNLPKLENPSNERLNNVWQACYDAQFKYFQSLPKGGPATLLLDEPDRSLSLTNQIDFWRKIVPDLADFQTLIATHSPLVFSLPYPVHVIDLQAGYYPECQKKFHEFCPTRF